MPHGGRKGENTSRQPESEPRATNHLAGRHLSSDSRLDGLYPLHLIGQVKSALPAAGLGLHPTSLAAGVMKAEKRGSLGVGGINDSGDTGSTTCSDALHIDTPESKENGNRTSAESLNSLGSKPEYTRIINPTDIVIVLTGQTGTGRTTFISTFLRTEEAREAAVVGTVLRAATTKITMYRVTYKGQDVVFVDTPGFDSDIMTDDLTLKCISDFLMKYEKYAPMVLLYFKNICDRRPDQIEPLPSLNTLSAMCRAQEVMLVTTMWDSLTELEIQARGVREGELANNMTLRLGRTCRTERLGSASSESTANLLQKIIQIVSPKGSSTAIRQESRIRPTRVLAAEATSVVKASDTVIVVMGPTGAGKTTFISAACGPDSTAVVPISHTLSSGTKEITTYRIKAPCTSIGDIVLVDTPGFDDTNLSDAVTLERISKWLQKTYEDKKSLTGLLYFHRITDNRMAGTPLKNLTMFQKICGEKSLKKVVLVTTMWDLLETEALGIKRERQLRDEYWKKMIELGSQFRRFTGTEDSAFGTMDTLWVSFQGGEQNLKAERRRIIKRSSHDLGSSNTRGTPAALQPILLQKELVDLGLSLEETAAGQALYSKLHALVQSREELLATLRDQIKEVERLKGGANASEETEEDSDGQNSNVAKRTLMKYQEELGDLEKELQEAYKVVGELKLGLRGRVKHVAARGYESLARLLRS